MALARDGARARARGHVPDVGRYQWADTRGERRRADEIVARSRASRRLEPAGRRHPRRTATHRRERHDRAVPASDACADARRRPIRCREGLDALRPGACVRRNGGRAGGLLRGRDVPSARVPGLRVRGRPARGDDLAPPHGVEDGWRGQRRAPPLQRPARRRVCALRSEGPTLLPVTGDHRRLSRAARSSRPSARCNRGPDLAGCAASLKRYSLARSPCPSSTFTRRSRACRTGRTRSSLSRTRSSLRWSAWRGRWRWAWRSVTRGPAARDDRGMCHRVRIPRLAGALGGLLELKPKRPRRCRPGLARSPRVCRTCRARVLRLIHADLSAARQADMSEGPPLLLVNG